MLEKTRFAKKSDGIFYNLEPIQNFSYDGCLDTRNSMHEEFFAQRMIIVHDIFLEILQSLLQKVKKTKRPLQILDLGCGDGVILQALDTLRKKTGLQADLYGLDIDEQILKSINVRAKKVVGSCTDMPFEQNSFDIITCSQTIEHITLPDLRKTLKEIYRVLKPGGICYFETPNPESLIAKSMGKNWWMYIDLHLILLTPTVLGRLLKKAKFIDIETGTRAELDRQMDEAQNVLRMFHVPYRLRHGILRSVVEKIITSMDLGGITIATARKPYRR